MFADMESPKQTISYRFAREFTTNFGEAVYLSGNINQLGNWDPQRAIKMTCDRYSYWNVEVIIPMETFIEYKYFIGPFEMQGQPKHLKWLGDENSKLKINEPMAPNFREKNRRSLKIMSFNVRYEGQKDRNQYSWTNRRDHCVETIVNAFPDIVGVQQPKSPQRKYLMSKVGDYYNYYGRPRNLAEDEEVGIFIRKDKFMVIEDGYIWINETKTEGERGFGARLPRYFTYLVVAPYSKQDNWFLVFNAHLDHQTPSSKLHGIMFISEVIADMKKKYPQEIKSVFVIGDFNTSDDDQIFNNLVDEEEMLESMRYSLPENESDYDATFNGFSKILNFIDKTMKFFNLDPGATIDHIFFRSETYKPVSFKCIRSEDKIVSDHYPVLGTFQSIQ